MSLPAVSVAPIVWVDHMVRLRPLVYMKTLAVSIVGKQRACEDGVWGVPPLSYGCYRIASELWESMSS